MPYKTIALGLLETREAPATLSLLTVTAELLKRIHLDWINRLHSARPADSMEQTRAVAMEFAIKELEDLLPAPSATEEHSQTA